MTTIKKLKIKQPKAEEENKRNQATCAKAPLKKAHLIAQADLLEAKSKKLSQPIKTAGIDVQVNGIKTAINAHSEPNQL